MQEAADRLYQWGTGNKLLMRKSFAIESRIERIVQTGKPTKEKTMRARFGETDFEGDQRGGFGCAGAGAAQASGSKGEASSGASK